MSGFASCSWAISDNPEKQGFKVGAKLGFEGDDPEKLVEFLKKQSAHDLTAAVFQMKLESRKVSYKVLSIQNSH